MLTCIDAKFIFDSWGDEWTLRAFASMRALRFFLRARGELKNLLREQRAA